MEERSVMLLVVIAGTAPLVSKYRTMPAQAAFIPASGSCARVGALNWCARTVPVRLMRERDDC